MSLNATAERLRSKHIRTLEALQAVVNENKVLKAQLEEARGGSGGAESPGDAASARAALHAELEAASAKLKALEAALEQEQIRSKRLVEDTKSNWAAKLAGLARQLQEAQASHSEERLHMTRTIKELEAALTEQKAKPVAQATPAPVRHVACQVYVPDPAASQAESDLAAARLETERLAREAATASKARKQAERALEQERKLHAETRQQLEAATAELEAAKAAAKAAPKRRASRGANSGAGARAAKLEEELKLAHTRALALQKEVERATAEAKEWSERAGVEAAESGRLKALLAEALGRLKRAGSQRKGPGNPFVEHVAVTKENAMLRQQVEMMKLERKKYLAKLKSGRMG